MDGRRGSKSSLPNKKSGCLMESKHNECVPIHYEKSCLSKQHYFIVKTKKNSYTTIVHPPKIWGINK
jgi:hypothetical protein